MIVVEFHYNYPVSKCNIFIFKRISAILQNGQTHSNNSSGIGADTQRVNP